MIEVERAFEIPVWEMTEDDEEACWESIYTEEPPDEDEFFDDCEEMEDSLELLQAEERFYREWLTELLISNTVLRACSYVSFVSRTKGRSRGRGKPRRAKPRLRHGWQEVELFGRGGSFCQIIDGRGPFDSIATEILGPSVLPKDAETVLLELLRASPELRRLAAGKEGRFHRRDILKSRFSQYL